MKRIRNGLLTSVLLLSMALPATAVAEDLPGVPDGQVTGQPHAGEHHEHHGKQKWKYHGTHLVHKQMYFTLLAEKYAPETASEWKKVFAERKRLMEEWKNLRAQKGHASSGQAQDSAEKKAFREKFKQTREAFDKAVEVGDAAAIKSALPQLLAVEKERNQRLAAKLEQLRKQ